jgi:hypothetical protein
MQHMQQDLAVLARNKMMLEFSTSGAAVTVATFCTNPIDVVKVRMQLVSSPSPSSGIVGTSASILRSEGASVLVDLLYHFAPSRPALAYKELR